VLGFGDEVAGDGRTAERGRGQRAVDTAHGLSDGVDAEVGREVEDGPESIDGTIEVAVAHARKSEVGTGNGFAAVAAFVVVGGLVGGDGVERGAFGVVGPVGKPDVGVGGVVELARPCERELADDVVQIAGGDGVACGPGAGEGLGGGVAVPLLVVEELQPATRRTAARRGGGSYGFQCSCWSPPRWSRSRGGRRGGRAVPPADDSPSPQRVVGGSGSRPDRH
jgi:hypothetical protein